MKLKKGSLEAKRFMAKIRAMKSGTKKKSIGATKMVEKQYKETSKTKPKRVVQITRDEFGQFKKFKQISGAKKKSIGATKMVEKQYKETSKTKPKRVIQITRDEFGQFKKFKQISGLHKDTKSHNVRISVVSGIKNDYAEKLIKYVKMLEMNENTLLNLRYKIKNKIDVLNNKIHYMETNNDIKKIKKHIITLKKHI